MFLSAHRKQSDPHAHRRNRARTHTNKQKQAHTRQRGQEQAPNTTTSKSRAPLQLLGNDFLRFHQRHPLLAPGFRHRSHASLPKIIKKHVGSSQYAQCDRDTQRAIRIRAGRQATDLMRCTS